MMRLLIPAILLVSLLAAGAARAQFVAGFEDLPLAPGLAMVDGSALSFDKPEGRIVEAVARGGTSRQAVADFYARALGELGWQPAGAGAGMILFQREDERLVISVSGRDGALNVRYQLSPAVR